MRSISGLEFVAGYYLRCLVKDGDFDIINTQLEKLKVRGVPYPLPDQNLQLITANRAMIMRHPLGREKTRSKRPKHSVYAIGVTGSKEGRKSREVVNAGVFNLLVADIAYCTR